MYVFIQFILAYGSTVSFFILHRIHSRNFKLSSATQRRARSPQKKTTNPTMQQHQSRLRSHRAKEPNWSPALRQRKTPPLWSNWRMKSRACVCCVWGSYRNSAAPPRPWRCVCCKNVPLSQTGPASWSEMNLTFCSPLTDSWSSEGGEVRVWHAGAVRLSARSAVCPRGQCRAAANYCFHYFMYLLIILPINWLIINRAFKWVVLFEPTAQNPKRFSLWSSETKEIRKSTHLRCWKQQIQAFLFEI